MLLSCTKPACKLVAGLINKIDTIKVIREVTSLGLREAKEAVEGIPSLVRESVPFDEAQTVVSKFESVGALAEVRNATELPVGGA